MIPDRETAPTRARISFAVIRLLSPAEDAFDALQQSMVPGTVAERYGRSWRMGQWTAVDGALFGRIGFEAPGGIAEVWNEDINDFEEQALPGGTTSPFAVTADLRVAFQLRGSRIRPNTFTGAFQALLNAGSPFWSWRVERELIGVSWEQWLEAVDRVIDLRIRLRRPNPHYSDRKAVEDLIEDARAELLTIDWKAQEDDPAGINVDDAFVREAIEHAADHGRWRARGEIGTLTATPEIEVDDRGQTVWRSEQQVTAPERQVEADPLSGEARHDALRRELDERRPPDTE